MQLGISSYTYGWSVDKTYSPNPVNEFELLQRVLGFGLNLLQIGDNLPLHENSHADIERFKEGLTTNSIQLEIGASGLTENHLRRYIQLCVRLNVRLLRFVIDAPGYEPEIAEVVKIINSQVHLLEQSNVRLAIENHDRFKAREFAAIMNAVNNANVGICLDTINSLGAGESIEYTIDILSPFTINLHLKDFGIARLLHKQGFIVDGRLTGHGMLNVPAIIEKLKPFNRCHTAILEQWVPPESDAGTTIKKELRWALEGINYLKQLDLFNS